MHINQEHPYTIKCMKKILPIILFAFLFLVPTVVWAGSFELTNIGTTSTAGRSFTQWTYYGTNPEFAGTAEADAEVVINIDDTTHTTTADSEGSWTWQPTTLTEGTYEVAVSSGDASQSFTLVIAPYESSDSATSSAATSGADALPVSGSFDQTLLLMIAAASLLLLGFGSKLLVASIEEK